MTLLVDDPDCFADEAVDDLVAASPQHLRCVRGGVVRARPGAAGSVALVVGGGSGPHPASAGWLGEGLAAGAACGGTFASPSAWQIRSVARVAGTGGGVLLGYGRYAEAAGATAEVPASVGRARTHGDRSVGTPDAGALSSGMVERAVVGDPSPVDAPAATGSAGRAARRGPVPS